MIFSPVKNRVAHKRLIRSNDPETVGRYGRLSPSPTGARGENQAVTMVGVCPLRKCALRRVYPPIPNDDESVDIRGSVQVEDLVQMRVVISW